MRFPAHKTVLALSLTLATAALTGCGDINDASIRPITVAEVAERLADHPEQLLVLDTRQSQAYQESHLPGARHVRSHEVDPRDPDPSLRGYDLIIVYGDNPGSAMAKATVKKLMIGEFGDVLWMEQGFLGWSAAGLPTESAAVSSP